MGKGLTVTAHAIDRYIERVEDVRPEVAIERLSSPAIMLAASLGHCNVKLGSGHRVIVQDGAVITVYAKWRGH